MKVAAVQMSGMPGDVQGNLEKIRSFARAGADAECSLLLFPEISDLGYDMHAIAETGATTWSRVDETLRELARELGICLVCGVTLPGNAGTANALVAFGPQGTILAQYRKIHLFRGQDADETGVFTPGDRLVAFELDGVRFGLAICYDLRFPEQFRSLALNGCHALLLASAWPRARMDLWPHLCVARAVENQCFLLGANRVGEHGAFPFGGQSIFVGPAGRLTMADGLREGLTCGDIDREELTETRTRIQALTHRRPELYADVTGKLAYSL